MGFLRRMAEAILPKTASNIAMSEEEVDLARSLAEKGDAQAQANLGAMYCDGVGVPENNFEAVQWYRKATDQGHALAQFSLGYMYDKGRGVPQDYAEAVKCYRMAAEQGDADAPLMMGNMYASGKGVPKDHVAAHMWFILAATSGHEAARPLLSVYKEDLTPDQIAEAQRMAREWMAKHQQ